MTHFYLPCRGETLAVVREKTGGKLLFRQRSQGRRALRSNSPGRAPGCPGEVSRRRTPGPALGSQRCQADRAVSFHQRQPAARLGRGAAGEGGRGAPAIPGSSARRTQAAPRTPQRHRPHIYGLREQPVAGTLATGEVSRALGLRLAAGRLHFNRSPSRSRAGWRRQGAASFVAAAGAEAAACPPPTRPPLTCT